MAVSLVYLMVFTIVGFGTLSLGGYLITSIKNQVNENRNDYKIESIMNKALWKLNHGPDSLANFTENGITTSFDPSTGIMMAYSTEDPTKKLSVTLIQDFPFNHGAAFKSETDTTKNNITTLPNHGIKQFNVWPQIDTDYFYANATKIYTTVEKFDTVMDPGIHIVESGTVRLMNGTSLNGTLVVLGKLKVVGSNIILRAQMLPDSTYLPALIVADSTADISTSPAITIHGAVFATGPLDLRGGSLTGPLVATTMRLSNNLNINDQSNDKYYHWPKGFGDIKSYDWDKEIRKGSWSN